MPMIVIVGPSASGKTFAAQALKREFGIVKAITHTTRKPRVGEVSGVDYFFVNEAEFARLAAKDYFVETTEYSGNHYGCSKAEISDDKVVILDPSGVASFKALNDPSIVFFHLTATKKTRKARMLERGDDSSSASKRMEDDEKAFAKTELKGIDMTIKTDDINSAEVAEKIYENYVRVLKKRGVRANLLIFD